MIYLILKVDLSNQSSVIEEIPAEIIENEKMTFRDASQALIEKLGIEK